MHHSSPFCPISLLLRLLELSSPSCPHACLLFCLLKLLKAAFHFSGSLPASFPFLASQELRPHRRGRHRTLRRTQRELRSLRGQRLLQERHVLQRSRRWGSKGLRQWSSQSWTTSRRWSSSGSKEFRWGRGSCTWRAHQRHRPCRCGKPGTQPQGPRSNLTEKTDVTDIRQDGVGLGDHFSEVAFAGAHREPIERRQTRAICSQRGAGGEGEERGCGFFWNSSTKTTHTDDCWSHYKKSSTIGSCRFFSSLSNVVLWPFPESSWRSVYDCVCANDVKNSPDGNCELPRQLFPFIWSHTGGSRLSLGQNINFSQIGSREDRGHQSSGARAPRLWCPNLFWGFFVLLLNPIHCQCFVLYTKTENENSYLLSKFLR